jgi:hypothetical protein
VSPETSIILMIAGALVFFAAFAWFLVREGKRK